jgi:hypothetical protein
LHGNQANEFADVTSRLESEELESWYHHHMAFELKNMNGIQSLFNAESISSRRHFVSDVCSISSHNFSNCNATTVDDLSSTMLMLPCNFFPVQPPLFPVCHHTARLTSIIKQFSQLLTTVDDLIKAFSVALLVIGSFAVLARVAEKLLLRILRTYGLLPVRITYVVPSAYARQLLHEETQVELTTSCGSAPTTPRRVKPRPPCRNPTAPVATAPLSASLRLPVRAGSKRKSSSSTAAGLVTCSPLNCDSVGNCPSRVFVPTASSTSSSSNNDMQQRLQFSETKV